jgi:hypothetical protein
MSRNWLRRVYIAALGRRSKRGIMNCSAKQLDSISLPNGWTVRVIYGDGSLPTTFTIEELKDIEKQIDLRSDWVTISVNRYLPKPPSEPGPPVDAVSGTAETT